MTVVEVIPLVASAAPIVVGRGIVSAVVGVLRLLVEGASLGVLDERLRVQVGRLLAVENSAHVSANKRSLDPCLHLGRIVNIFHKSNVKVLLI